MPLFRRCSQPCNYMDVIVAYHITYAQGGISRRDEQDSRGQVRWTFGRGVSAGASTARELALVLDEVDQHVVAEVLRRGEERPAAVDLGELFDERLE